MGDLEQVNVFVFEFAGQKQMKKFWKFVQLSDVTNGNGLRGHGLDVCQKCSWFVTRNKKIWFENWPTELFFLTNSERQDKCPT